MAAADDRARFAEEDGVQFGPFRVDRARRLLTKAGTPVPLGDRAFELLAILVRHAPEIVSKTVLLEQAWPDTFVEEATLRYHMWVLRKALGVGANGSRYISTVSGKGYCFIAPLAPSPSVATTTPAGDGGTLDAATESTPPDTNLPLRLTEIIGRERELVELGDWLKSSRLVTVVGPGGVGKTRLAAELGWRVLQDFAAGVWLIDLAPLTDQDAVAGAVAATLGVSVTKAEAAVHAVIAALGRTKRLLILDNCEHLATAAAPLIKSLLERAPGVSILVTSQRTLHLAGEHVYSLDPLAVPPPGAIDIGGYAAVQFFIHRARAADRLFALQDGNSASIGAICRQLDGLPLALEMAAGRLPLLGVERLRHGLDDRLRMLKSAGHGGRYSSLHGMLEWSHSLLTAFDQKVFRRLAVFAGSFTLQAAVAVAGSDDDERELVVDALGRLIDGSLVTLEQREPARYRLLETLHVYATGKLRDAGEAEAVAERHARHFTLVFDTAEQAWEHTPDPIWITRYQPELEHFRTAIDWALAMPERRQSAFAIAASGIMLLRWLWLLGKGRRYLDRIIPQLDSATPPAIAARLLHEAALFCVFVDDPRGLSFAEQSVALCDEQKDRATLANALATIAQYLARKEQFAEAQALLLRAQQLLADGTLKKSQLRLTAIAGSFCYRIQDIEGAKRHHSTALALARPLKSRYEALLLSDLGVFEDVSGNVDRAIELTRAALLCSRAQLGGSQDGVITTNLASYLIARGDLTEARMMLEEALSVLIEQGNFPSEFCLRLWASLLGFEGRLVEAAQLVGFTDAERARSELAMLYSERPLHDRLMAILAAGLPSAELDAWLQKGAQWSEAEAIQHVADQLAA